jgi:hypothetical protein
MTDWLFQPLVPWGVLGAVVLIGLAVAVLGARRPLGAALRALWVLALAGVLANPVVRQEQRALEPDVAVAVIDRSASMAIDSRGAQAERALQALQAQAPDLTWRVAAVPASAPGGPPETRLFETLEQALGAAPPDRLAGAVVITDGQAHDTASLERLKALGRPVHMLIAGDAGLLDRRLTVAASPPYAIVGTTAQVTLRVEAGAERGPFRLSWSLNGTAQPERSVRPGEQVVLDVPVSQRGRIDVAATLAPAAGETLLANNSVLATIQGVRDRLRVLLVSGQPYPGGRLWRDVLKADPAIDLIHFTILRLPTSIDPTPSSELSLIPFPVDQLFRERLPDFDLVVFDRYASLDLLDPAYLVALADRVRTGGSLLVITGPEYNEPGNLGDTALATVLPASPVLRAQGAEQLGPEQFTPAVTPLGARHPITRTLQPPWGPWFELTPTTARAGETLMAAPGGVPVLQISNAGEGRVAMMLSDQLWVWARGSPGGPWDELLRRLSHWLMREPELEGEQLTASTSGRTIRIERRTLGEAVPPVRLTPPQGTAQPVPMQPSGPGAAAGSIEAATPGLYRIESGALSRAVLVGADGREFEDIRPTEAKVAPLAQATGGAVRWLAAGIPEMRRVSPGASAQGPGWIGLVANQAGRLVSVAERSALPAWLALLGLLGLGLAAWLAERR